MKQNYRRPLAAATFFLAVAATALPMIPAWRQAEELPSALNSNDRNASSPQLVVDLRDDVSDADVAQIEAQSGLDLQPNSATSRDSKTYRARLGASADRAAILKLLRDDARVEVAEPETQIAVPIQPKRKAKSTGAEMKTNSRASGKGLWLPDDPRFDEQWNMAMVGAPQAWRRSRGRGIIVAVIDTGVALKESAGGVRCRDFDRTRGVDGYNFVDDSDDAYDDLGHGTHVAGTIAESTDNGEGVAGLAFEASIMPLKVFGAQGFGSSVDIADAIRFAADHGAHVINMSLGGPTPNRVVLNAMKYAKRRGVLVVCSAGNSGGGPVGYPAAFPQALAVSSVGPSGNLAFYSSVGRQVAIAAPGGDTFESGEFNESGGVLQNAFWPESQGGRGDDYYFFQGTSMAAPHVAATAALVMAQGVGDCERVRDILLRSATPNDGPRVGFGAGVLSADGATSLASRQIWNGRFFAVALAVIAALIFLGARRTLSQRFALAAMVVLGALIPAVGGAWFGANAVWNVVTFSALLPFLLFWEWEVDFKSTLAGNFAAGTALFLFASLGIDGLSPLMASTFHGAQLLWTGGNALAAAALASLSWQRARLR